MIISLVVVTCFLVKEVPRLSSFGGFVVCSILSWKIPLKCLFSFIIRNEKRASKVFSFFSMGSYSLLFFSCCLVVAAVVVVQQRVQWQLSNVKRNCHENLWRATKFFGVCTSCWMVYKTAPLRTSFKRFPFSRLFLFFSGFWRWWSNSFEFKKTDL